MNLKGKPPKPKQFSKIRERALRNWLNGTGRQLTTHKDVMTDHFDCGYECGWQNLSRDIHGNFYHVSIFCSMGEWASNITDILTDPRRDRLKYTDVQDKEILFRYYSRFMLVAMDVFDDFTTILQNSNIGMEKQDKARTHLSLPMSVNHFAGYVNHFVKHKANPSANSPHLHYCNHHLEKYFDDSGLDHSYSQAIKMGSHSVSDPDAICIPSLIQIVDSLLYAYQVTDDMFRQEDQVVLKNITEIYGKSLRFKTLSPN